MTPHDRWLELDEDDDNECDRCDGEGIVIDRSCKDSFISRIMNGTGTIKCPLCNGTGIYTEAERRQKAFDDFDPPDSGDFGEPL